MPGAAVVAALAYAPLAHADLWGYVDERGQSHFAAERLDERYQLFYKGRTTLDAPAHTDAGALARIRATPLYGRVATSPNVERFAALIDASARRVDLDPALVKAVIAVESAFDPEAVSSKGAVGLMQLLPETAERYGVSAGASTSVVQKLLDPAINVSVGTKYLHDLLARFANDLTLALAAYNAGEQAVDAGARVPPYPETQAYVRLVQDFYAFFRGPTPPPELPATPAGIAIPRAPPQR